MIPFQMMAKPYLAQGALTYHLGGNCSPLKISELWLPLIDNFSRAALFQKKKSASRTDPHLHPERDRVCLLKPADEPRRTLSRSCDRQPVTCWNHTDISRSTRGLFPQTAFTALALIRATFRAATCIVTAITFPNLPLVGIKLGIRLH